MIVPNTQLAIGTLTGPTSLIADWKSVLTGPAAAINLHSDGFSGNETANASAIFKRDGGAGTNIRVRLFVPTDTTSTTSLKYALAGAFWQGGDSTLISAKWELLPNLAGDVESTISVSATDFYSSGSDDGYFTTASWTNHTHDGGGNTHFAIIVTQGLVLADAGEYDAVVQVKII